MLHTSVGSLTLGVCGCLLLCAVYRGRPNKGVAMETLGPLYLRVANKRHGHFIEPNPTYMYTLASMILNLFTVDTESSTMSFVTRSYLEH